MKNKEFARSKLHKLPKNATLTLQFLNKTVGYNGNRILLWLFGFLY